MKLLIAISDSESNILAGHSAGAWGFKLKPNKKGEISEHILHENEESRPYFLAGNFITFWCTEKENNAQGFIGLGVITGSQIPGKINRNIWLDGDYYGELPVKLLTIKKMPIQIVRNMYGNNWNRNHFNPFSGNLPAADLSDQQMQDFIVYMLT